MGLYRQVLQEYLRALVFASLAGSLVFLTVGLIGGIQDHHRDRLLLVTAINLVKASTV